MRLPDYDIVAIGAFFAARGAIAIDALGRGKHVIADKPPCTRIDELEEGKHGGTLTDIFIHAADAIPWMTGLSFERVEAARCWNALAPQYPHFEDGAQVMLTMSNGCGVMGDVSYFMPSVGGYSLPYYWRTTFFGSEGIAEVSATSDLIDISRDGRVASVDPEGPEPEGYLAGFLGDIAGTASPESLRTADVLRATRVALKVQRAADEGRSASVNLRE